MIHVIATIHLKPDAVDSFLAEFHQIVPLVLAEQGCLAYGPTMDLETNIPAQPDVRLSTVVIMEQWQDLDSLESHLIAPHMLTYRQKVKDYIESVQLQVLKPV
ncbi:MAG: putative quinol monooxygenase [Pirellulaceae bacterium]